MPGGIRRVRGRSCSAATTASLPACAASTAWACWSEAFIKHEITLVETDKGWTLTKGGKMVIIDARDNRVVRYALAFVGLSPKKVAENLADVLAA
jgi:RNA 3'-terminal phosphate cyclase